MEHLSTSISGWSRALLAVLFFASGSTLASAAVPELRSKGATRQLFVDGKPFLARSGEVGNSTGEPDYLRPYWPKFQALNLNTLVVPLYWDQIEPEEGRFDFSTLDGLLADARAHDMRLVLLWFGSWKNSMSCYAPAWVKTDLTRFPRSVDASGRTVEILSPFSDANRDADARAFAAVMRRLREVDTQHTVVMVQVENEIGMIPSARDHSDEANRLFAGPIPEELSRYLAENADRLVPALRDRWRAAGAKTKGTWTEVFGRDDLAATEEIFMAWHFARYTHAVAAAGKAELPLPMFANAALIRPAYRPGQYPSAGPLPHLLDIWRAGAPAIDFIAPDIYFPNFAEWADRYAKHGNPLFIPEALRNTDAAANALYAYGEHGAIGFSPFGIESIEAQPARMLTGANDLVRQLTPLIVQHTGERTMIGLLPPAAEQRKPHERAFGGVVLNVTYERVAAPSLADGVINEAGDRPSDRTVLPAAAIAIQTGPDEFVFGGIGVTITFSSENAGEHIGLLSVEEGRYVDGKWQRTRWLNGDQTHQGRHVRLEPGRFVIQRVKLYRYR